MGWKARPKSMTRSVKMQRSMARRQRFGIQLRRGHMGPRQEGRATGAHDPCSAPASPALPIDPPTYPRRPAPPKQQQRPQHCPPHAPLRSTTPRPSSSFFLLPPNRSDVSYPRFSRISCRCRLVRLVRRRYRWTSSPCPPRHSSPLVLRR
jgi:hypothetical protein